MFVDLVEMKPDNWRDFAALEVCPEQRGAVAEPLEILARAWVYRADDAAVWGILVAGSPAGLLSERTQHRPDGPMRIFDEFLIDRRFQGKGVGSAVLTRRMAELADRGVRQFGLCYVDRFPRLAQFYARLGFHPSGDRDGDEVILIRRA